MSDFRISAVVAMSQNRVIGQAGGLPWHLSEDLKRFKALTLGHTVVMGRKTFESIGRPLPQRKSIVISRGKTSFAPFDPSLVNVVTSLELALKSCADEKEVFIIGGGEIYQAAMPWIHRIYLTLIHAEIEGDTYFPVYDPAVFLPQSQTREMHQQGELKYEFLVLDRKV